MKSIRMTLLALAVTMGATGALTPLAQAQEAAKPATTAASKAKTTKSKAAKTTPAKPKTAKSKPAPAKKPKAVAAKPAAKKPAEAKPTAKTTAKKPAPAKAAEKPAEKPAKPKAAKTEATKPAAKHEVAKPEPAKPEAAKPEAKKPAAQGQLDASAMAFAGEATLLGQYGDWGAYAATPSGHKVCFALAKPESTQASKQGIKRDQPYLFIATRPAEKVKNEISVVLGYPLKPNEGATALVGSATFAMFTQKDGAWIKNAAEEPQLVDSMRKGADLVLKGISARGTNTTDTYSLKGVAEALDKVAQACK